MRSSPISSQGLRYLLDTNLIWQFGWTEKQLGKDSDRVAATKSVMATMNAQAIASSTAPLCGTPQSAASATLSLGIATLRIDLGLLQYFSALAPVPDAADRAKLFQLRIVLVFFCTLSPAALDEIRNLRLLVQ